ncbi:DUF6783 domain-containing protein [Enterocloster lavalensis]
MGTKYAAKWGVQMVGMNFQTHPSITPAGREGQWDWVVN